MADRLKLCVMVAVHYKSEDNTTFNATRLNGRGKWLNALCVRHKPYTILIERYDLCSFMFIHWMHATFFFSNSLAISLTTSGPKNVRAESETKIIQVQELNRWNGTLLQFCCVHGMHGLGLSKHSWCRRVGFCTSTNVTALLFAVALCCVCVCVWERGACAMTVNHARDSADFLVCTAHTHSFLLFTRAFIFILLVRLKFIWTLKFWYNFNDGLCRCFRSFHFTSRERVWPVHKNCFRFAGYWMSYWTNIWEHSNCVNIERMEICASPGKERQKKIVCQYIPRSNGIRTRALVNVVWEQKRRDQCRCRSHATLIFPRG